MIPILEKLKEIKSNYDYALEHAEPRPERYVAQFMGGFIDFLDEVSKHATAPQPDPASEPVAPLSEPERPKFDNMTVIGVDQGAPEGDRTVTFTPLPVGPSDDTPNAAPETPSLPPEDKKPIENPEPASQPSTEEVSAGTEDATEPLVSDNSEK